MTLSPPLQFFPFPNLFFWNCSLSLTRLPAKRVTSSMSFSFSTALYPIIYSLHLFERAGNSDACSEIAGKVTRPSVEIAGKGEINMTLTWVLWNIFFYLFMTLDKMNYIVLKIITQNTKNLGLSNSQLASHNLHCPYSCLVAS